MRTALSFRGFSLIELMIVVAIIGVIAAIAFPSYVRYVERTQVNDGRAGLLAAAQMMERCYVQEMRYDSDACGGVGGNSPEGFYSIVATDRNARTFTLTATGDKGRVGLEDHPCYEITLNQAGVMHEGACPH